MTRDDIIRMAQEADFEIDDGRSSLLKVWVEGVNITDAIECFAALVAAHEREACAKYVAESFGKELVDGQDVAAAIRARGET